MTRSTRRHFLHQGAIGLATVGGWTSMLRGETFEPKDGGLQLAPFRFDVTPPIGHSLCGGWIKPAEVVDDPLEAIGLVILGAGRPLVVCSVDWTGILNEAHLQWRTTLAEAAGTTPDRVAVHCVHQHNAPFACLSAQRLVAAQGDLPAIVDESYFGQCLARGRAAVMGALRYPQPLTHVAYGSGRVAQVASNRRVDRGDDGKVGAMRGSSCRDARLRSLPEGLIDPWLKTVVFYNGDRKLAACHYYATHPMSYYGDGRVNSDFAGMARKHRQEDEPNCTHLYFTGCAGNIAAGKYNDGSHAQRKVLTDRLYSGLVASEADLNPTPIQRVQWRTLHVTPPPHSDPTAESLEQMIADKKRPVVGRNRPAYQLAYIRRIENRVPICLSSLHINDVCLLHLPGECFVQYQLRAQQMNGPRMTAVAAYGDGGPWYIPVAEEYDRGGYEVSVAFCARTVDSILTDGVRSLVRADA